MQETKKDVPKNKIAKAVAASALGVSLLVGGGTFALWNSDSTLNSNATITTGDLQVKASSVEKWVDVTNSESPVTIENLSDYRLVPGSKIKLSQSINAIIKGDNIAASLKVQMPNTTSGPALTQSVYTITVKDSNDAVLATSTADSKNSDGTLIATLLDLKESGDTGTNLKVEVTVELPENADNSTKSQIISLGDMQITLEQILP